MTRGLQGTDTPTRVFYVVHLPEGTNFREAIDTARRRLIENGASQDIRVVHVSGGSGAVALGTGATDTGTVLSDYTVVERAVNDMVSTRQVERSQVSQRVRRPELVEEHQRAANKRLLFVAAGLASIGLGFYFWKRRK